MPEFRTAYSSPVRFPSPVGEGFEPIYTPIFLEGETRILKETGKRDLYAFIQSFKEESSIQRIIQRYSQGDLSVLQRVQALYLDTTGLPGSLDEAFQKVIDAKRSFYDLTPEAQAYYGDPNSFIQRFASGDVFNSPAVDTNVKEVDTVE